jgi:cell division protein FtsW (lipid II flippase)
MMKLTFEVFFPALRPWVVNLVNVWPAYIIKPQFAFWEVLHILALVLLGGTAILMNLRLVGAGMTEEPPSEIYRNLRRWQDVGVIGIVVTGILIGMANAERLYDSTAFVVKMIALVAGVVLTYGASRPVARADGAVSTSAKAWFAVGALIWIAGLVIFVTGNLVNVGVYHVITAAALVALAATRGRLRWIYLIGLLAMVAIHQWITHVTYADPFDLAHLDPVNKTFTWLYSIWIVAAALAQVYLAGRGRTRTAKGAAAGPLAELIAYSTILVWVTGAAAGRWIAFA